MKSTLYTLALESLETRRLRFDLTYLYKISFGKVDIEGSSMFEFVSISITLGHCCKSFVKLSQILQLISFNKFYDTCWCLTCLDIIIQRHLRYQTVNV